MNSELYSNQVNLGKYQEFGKCLNDYKDVITLNRNL